MRLKEIAIVEVLEVQ